VSVYECLDVLQVCLDYQTSQYVDIFCSCTLITEFSNRVKLKIVALKFYSYSSYNEIFYNISHMTLTEATNN
jgi:hypothetical protein